MRFDDIYSPKYSLKCSKKANESSVLFTFLKISCCQIPPLFSILLTLNGTLLFFPTTIIIQAENMNS